MLHAEQQRVLHREKRTVVHDKQVELPIRHFDDKSIYQRYHASSQRLSTKDSIPDGLDDMGFNDPYFNDQWYLVSHVHNVALSHLVHWSIAFSAFFNAVGWVAERLFCVVVNLVIHVNIGLLYICVVVSWFMVALCNRETIYIFMLWFVLLLLLSFFFFPRLISAVGDWMATILWHMVWS